MAAEPAQHIGIGARQFDCACQRARAKRAGAAAARHPHLRQPVRHNGAERDIAEEGICHRHPIEQHQSAAGSITAQCPQSGPLRRWIGRAAIRPAELLEPGDCAQSIFDPARTGRHQGIAINELDVISRAGRCGRQATALYHDQSFIALILHAIDLLAQRRACRRHGCRCHRQRSDQMQPTISP